MIQFVTSQIKLSMDKNCLFWKAVMSYLVEPSVKCGKVTLGTVALVRVLKEIRCHFVLQSH